MEDKVMRNPTPAISALFWACAVLALAYIGPQMLAVWGLWP